MTRPMFLIQLRGKNCYFQDTKTHKIVLTVQNVSDISESADCYWMNPIDSDNQRKYVSRETVEKLCQYVRDGHTVDPITAKVFMRPKPLIQEITISFN